MGRRDQDPLRGMRRGRRADRRGRGRVARRRDRPLLDPRLGEPRVRARGVRDGRRARAHAGRPARPRDVGGVVPGRLGLGDARADPPVVLLAALHVRRAHGPGAVPEGARLREDARRDRPRDAQLVGEHDRRARRLRAHGSGRDALAVLRATPRPEPAVRLRAGPRDPAQAAPALALRHVPDAVRQRGVLRAALRRPRRGGGCERPARSLARRAHAPARRGGNRRLRALADGRRDQRVRVVPRRPLELVHPLLAASLLGGRRGCASRALARDRPVAAGDRAGPALPRGAPVAGARPRAVPRRAGLGVPRRLAGRLGAGRRRSRRDGRRAPDRRPRPGRAVGLRRQAAPTARPPRRRRRVTRRRPGRHRARRAPREGRRARPRRGRARREAEPAGARPEARQGPRGGARGARGRRVRRPRRGPLSRRRPRARARRGARGAVRSRRLGDRLRGRCHGRARHGGRRGARARGTRLRADPPGQHDAQGGRPRAHRPHRADDPVPRRRPARACGLDQGRDARDLARGLGAEVVFARADRTRGSCDRGAGAFRDLPRRRRGSSAGFRSAESRSRAISAAIRRAAARGAARRAGGRSRPRRPSGATRSARRRARGTSRRPGSRAARAPRRRR